MYIYIYSIPLRVPECTQRPTTTGQAIPVPPAPKGSGVDAMNTGSTGLDHPGGRDWRVLGRKTNGQKTQSPGGKGVLVAPDFHTTSCVDSPDSPDLLSNRRHENNAGPGSAGGGGRFCGWVGEPVSSEEIPLQARRTPPRPQETPLWNHKSSHERHVQSAQSFLFGCVRSDLSSTLPIPVNDSISARGQPKMIKNSYSTVRNRLSAPVESSQDQNPLHHHLYWKFEAAS